MKRIFSISLCLLLIASFAYAKDASVSKLPNANDYNVVVDGPGAMLTSSSSLAFSKLGADSFMMFGGPENAPEGRFQDATGVLADEQGWLTVDLTDMPTMWQHSSYNMGNLNNHGAGNYGMWAGQDCSQQNTWDHCPGYGNGWFAILIYESAVLQSTAAGQTVGLDFYLNHDTEPGYDYFIVEYDSAGAWTEVYAEDGSNYDSGTGTFPVPGVHYPDTANGVEPIVFTGADYGGENGDQIVLRFVLNSDGAWSDEDGLWPTHGGGAQVDDITVSYDDGGAKGAVVDFEDFEAGPMFLWMPLKAPYAGDFSKTFARVNDNDPCLDNLSPVWTFIDDGTPPRNPDNITNESTGGTTSINWSYGVPGGWVVNYNGGLTYGEQGVFNEIWSPIISWDYPTTDDDDPEWAGAVLTFDVWRHLPLANGLFYAWHVRSSNDNQATWTGWADRNFVYYGSVLVGDWLNVTQDVTDLLMPGATDVQIALCFWDYADVFNFPGTDATPSPLFDNVRFIKYRVDGPVFATRNIDLFNDAFPTDGTLTGPCAMDMARDIMHNDGTENVHGDSIVVDIVSVIPGDTLRLEDIKIIYIADINPAGEGGVRTPPAGATVTVGTAANGWDQWAGEYPGYESFTSAGARVEDRFEFYLPDDEFFAGDVVRYYIQAADHPTGRTTTLPANIGGFADGVGYNRAFTVHCLPTIDLALDHPEILFWNDFGHRGGEAEWWQAFNQNGYFENVDFDVYTTQGPSSGVANGLGASGSGGATADQLAGYTYIFYDAGNLSSFLLSDGSNEDLNDRGDDIGVLTGWHELAGDRSIVYFGDNIASGIEEAGAAGITYVATVMGVDVTNFDATAAIGGQTAPVVLPLDARFAETWVAYGGCGLIDTFDELYPLAGATRTHGFEDPDNLGTVFAPSAGVSYERPGVSGTLQDLTFPVGFYHVYDKIAKAGNVSARGQLVNEVMGYFGAPAGSGAAVGNPVVARRGVYDLSNYPNPFNPSTTIQFTLGAKSQATVKVYNLRGELVATVHDGMLEQGLNKLTWNGLDSNGASVASGVYMIKVAGDGESLTKKVALVK